MSLLSNRAFPSGQYLVRKKPHTVVAALALTTTIALILFAIGRFKTNLILSTPSTYKSEGEAAGPVTGADTTTPAPASASGPAPSTAPQPCGLDVNVFGVDALAPAVDYTRCEITVTYSDADPGFVQQLDVPLPKSHLVRLDGAKAGRQSMEECPDPVTVQVPTPAENPDASGIIFGVATKLERLDDSLDAFAHWAGRSNTTIFVLIEPMPAADREKVEDKARGLKIKLRIKESDANFNDRYFSLIQHLSQERKTARWAAIIDDDTFFPSMAALVGRLDRLDPSQPYYVGGLSEDMEQIRRHGIMAYGGAGVFISAPVLEAMNAHWDECNGAGGAGDWRIALCIYRHTTTKLTWEHGLGQVDLRGDPSGFYEAGRSQPLSVHHWKSWNHIDMARLGAVSDVCGDACLLMRWRFLDGWTLTNGYSVVKYSDDDDSNDSDGDESAAADRRNLPMEKTWDDVADVKDESFFHSLSPLRPKDEAKVSYSLHKVVRDGPGRLRQYYVHHSADNGPIDRVLEVVWRR